MAHKGIKKAKKRNSGRQGVVQPSESKLPANIEERLLKDKRQQKWIKWLSLILVFAIMFTSFILVLNHDRAERRKKKIEFVRGLYESMYISNGFTLTYSLDVKYSITSGTLLQNAELHYIAKEETDQLGKKKRLTLTMTGNVTGTEITTKQIYYYDDGKCVQETQYVDDDGQKKSRFEERNEEISYEYNPMLALATMVMDKPGEYTKKQNTLYGSVAMSDIDTFLKMCPFNTMFEGIESLECYEKQVNKLTIISDGTKINTVTVDLKPTAWFLVKNFYEEQNMSIEMEEYRLTMMVDSWEIPVIEMPEVEAEEKA